MPTEILTMMVLLATAPVWDRDQGPNFSTLQENRQALCSLSLTLRRFCALVANLTVLWCDLLSPRHTDGMARFQADLDRSGSMTIRVILDLCVAKSLVLQVLAAIQPHTHRITHLLMAQSPSDLYNEIHQLPTPTRLTHFYGLWKDGSEHYSPMKSAKNYCQYGFRPHTDSSIWTHPAFSLFQQPTPHLKVLVSQGVPLAFLPDPATAEIVSIGACAEEAPVDSSGDWIGGAGAMRRATTAVVLDLWEVPYNRQFSLQSPLDNEHSTVTNRLWEGVSTAPTIFLPNLRLLKVSTGTADVIPYLLGITNMPNLQHLMLRREGFEDIVGPDSIELTEADAPIRDSTLIHANFPHLCTLSTEFISIRTTRTLLSLAPNLQVVTINRPDGWFHSLEDGIDNLYDLTQAFFDASHCILNPNLTTIIMGLDDATDVVHKTDSGAPLFGSQLKHLLECLQKAKGGVQLEYVSVTDVVHEGEEESDNGNDGDDRDGGDDDDDNNNNNNGHYSGFIDSGDDNDNDQAEHVLAAAVRMRNFGPMELGALVELANAVRESGAKAGCVANKNGGLKWGQEFQFCPFERRPELTFPSGPGRTFSPWRSQDRESDYNFLARPF